MTEHSDQSHQLVRGRVVVPTNRHYASGIHDDATAQAAGFRGGTIAGSAHLDTIVPLALEQFGDDWFMSGSVSIKFAAPTTDGEPTFVELGGFTYDPIPNQHQIPDQRQVRILRSPDELLVGSGTVGGPRSASPTQLRAEPPRHDASAARILAGLQQGQRIGPATDAIDGKDLEHRCTGGLITEPLNWYVHTSPWGNAIAPPSAIIDAANRVISAQLLPILPPAVGMWSALEVQFTNGPVFVDRRYTVTGTVAAISDSPKTEVIWQDVRLVDPDTGNTVASVLIQSRFVKSTSSLWNEV
jgi:hypothetical protein